MTDTSISFDNIANFLNTVGFECAIDENELAYGDAFSRLFFKTTFDLTCIALLQCNEKVNNVFTDKNEMRNMRFLFIDLYMSISKLLDETFSKKYMHYAYSGIDHKAMKVFFNNHCDHIGIEKFDALKQYGTNILKIVAYIIEFKCIVENDLIMSFDDYIKTYTKITEQYKVINDCIEKIIVASKK